jgi:hypothetical protein
MKLQSYLMTSILFVAMATPVFAVSPGLAPYTDNPLVEFLARQRYHVVLGVQADTASNDHDPVTLVGGFGYFPMDKLSVGLYASLRNSDRKHPTEMRQMYGFGLFSEYNFAPDAVLQPFGGLRLGFIDTTGPANPTTQHAALLGGVKFSLNRNLALTAAGVLNWTKDEILDHKESFTDGNVSYSGSNTDVGIEIGLRFGF